MIENRELTMDDYVSMLRRRAKVILIPTLLATLLGYAAYLVAARYYAKYTSISTILVQGQKVPENMVQPVVSEDLGARMATLQQQVLSQTNLQPLVGRVYPGKNNQETAEMIDTIRANVKIEQVFTDLLQLGAKRRPGSGANSGGYNISYTAPNPVDAQRICSELTSLLMQENAKSVQAAANGTSVVLSKGIEDAKHDLDTLDSKLAAFKKQYVGQLPGDEENNLKILMGLNSQLEANTQTLNRAQQDKTYTESMLAQQLATWKSAQSSTNPQTLEKQLSELQSQLLSLEARYTADHPDVIKTKSDISEVKKKLAEINQASSTAGDTATDKASGLEPPEIRQLRTQVHQYSDLITAATRDQKRFQQEIAVYQGRVSLSPAVEEEYKGLTRDYENATKSYQELLSKKSAADLTVNMTNQAQGEQMALVSAANLPDSPSFPNWMMFTGGGLAFGMIIGVILTGWLELRDTSIRTEADAQAVLALPMLVSVPWVGSAAAARENGNGKYKFWKRNKTVDDEKETVEV